MNLDAEDMADILVGIRDEGGPAVWVSLTRELKDPAKPWLGTTATPTEHSVSISFVDMATAAALLKQWRPGTVLSSSSLFGLMGNHGFDPNIGETVKRSEKEDLVVKDVTEAAPTGTPLFYVLEFKA